MYLALAENLSWEFHAVMDVESLAKGAMLGMMVNACSWGCARMTQSTCMASIVGMHEHSFATCSPNIMRQASCLSGTEPEWPFGSIVLCEDGKHALH